MVFLYPARSCFSDETESLSVDAPNSSEENSLTHELDWTNGKNTPVDINPTEKKMTEALKLCGHAHGKASKKFAVKKALFKSSSQLPLIISKIKNKKRKKTDKLGLGAAADRSPNYLGRSSSWLCRNSGCRAKVPIDDTFCRRCSCCICHSFDEKQDPSLWLVCGSESLVGDDLHYCGLSCHLNCAIRCSKVGVFNLDHNLMQLDGCYCCAFCGKISGAIGCWRKQLIVAKDASRLNVLCSRVYLSYKLLSGTYQFKQLHEIVMEAKARLETQVGLLDEESAKKVRGKVNRLGVASLVQKLCSLAIKRADELMVLQAAATGLASDHSRPAACRFLFEQVTSSSVTIIIHLVQQLVFNNKQSNEHGVKSYKLWYYKSKDWEETQPASSSFQPSHQNQGRFMVRVSNLQPCTEYTFRVISYTENGRHWGHSQAKCFTKSVEIMNTTTRKRSGWNDPIMSSAGGAGRGSVEYCGGFRVRELGKLLHLPGNSNNNNNNNNNNNANMSMVKCVSGGGRHEHEGLLDLNVVLVGGDENEVEVVGDDLRLDGPAVVGSRPSKKWARVEMMRGEDRALKAQMLDDDKYEKSVKMLRWLECKGHIDRGFRVKMVTWLSLRATQQERMVVHTFIQTLMDEPSCLAAQLLHSFSDVVSTQSRIHLSQPSDPLSP